MNKILLPILVFFAACTTPQNQGKAPREGVYKLTGTNQGTTAGTYFGTVSIEKAGDLYNLTWNIGITQSQSGIAILENDVLSVSYADNSGRDSGVVSYRVKSETELEGKWTPLTSKGGYGFEILQYQGPLEEADLTHTNPDSASKSSSQLIQKFLTATSSESPMACETIVDAFCKDLWTSEVPGSKDFSPNLKVRRGWFENGFTDFSFYSFYKNLANRRCSLPVDLQKKLKVSCGSPSSTTDILARIGQLYDLAADATYKDTLNLYYDWKEEIDALIKEYDNSKTRVVQDRVNKLKPETIGKRWSAYGHEEKRLHYKIDSAAAKEILDVLYVPHPSWLLAQNIFSQAKSDVLSIVAKLDYPPSLLARITHKLKNVTLTLPYPDPETPSRMCVDYGSKGAEYIFYKNKVRLCLGFLVPDVSEGLLYSILAHELGHVIDPVSFAFDIFEETSSARLAKEVYFSNSTLTCDAWESKKKQWYQLSAQLHPFASAALKFPKCFNESVHKVADTTRLINTLEAATKTVAAEIESLAKTHTFTELSEKQSFAEMPDLANEYYLNPLLLDENKHSYYSDSYYRYAGLHLQALFVQELKCRNKSTQNETSIFAEALAETSRMATAYQAAKYALSGNRIPSDDVGQDHADWVSRKALEIYIAREKDLIRRRELILGTQTYDCSSGEYERMRPSALEKVSLEQKYSKESFMHTNGKSRRLSFFTPQIAKLVNCHPPESQPTDRCDLEMFKK